MRSTDNFQGDVKIQCLHSHACPDHPSLKVTEYLSVVSLCVAEDHNNHQFDMVLLYSLASHKSRPNFTTF